VLSGRGGGKGTGEQEKNRRGGREEGGRSSRVEEKEWGGRKMLSFLSRTKTGREKKRKEMAAALLVLERKGRLPLFDMQKPGGGKQRMREEREKKNSGSKKGKERTSKSCRGFLLHCEDGTLDH